MNNEGLIAEAAKAIRVHTTPGGHLIGDVGATLITSKGQIFSGVCVDTPGWGLCAERSAMAAMISSGEYVVAKIVAVWRKSETGDLYILPPCGICREFLRSVDPKNLEAEIILGRNRSEGLARLLPEHNWPEPLE